MRNLIYVMKKTIEKMWASKGVLNDAKKEISMIRINSGL